MIKFIGLDPGLAETGFGIIQYSNGKYLHICHNVISTKSSLKIGERLSIIYNAIIEVLDEYKPDRAGIESLFFSKNKLSAIPVAQSKGVLLLALEQRGIPVSEYPPKQVKQMLTGNGRAEKPQLQEFVRIVLGLKEIPKPNHAADALAVAVCCSTGYNQEIIGLKSV